ncbi:P-loop containing nucleoside triphosphate hydrolase protein [Xylariaceae sp. FL0804]|nr:P-loop containing nucleoside triphosphate hydrolase protein [Xylariaceae sp. FL0804]
MLQAECAMQRLASRCLFAGLPARISSPKRPSRHPDALSIPVATYATDTSTPSFPVKPMQLRYYQEECIQSVLASVRQGQKRLGISLATGAGKTVVFTQLIDRIQAGNETASQTLVLAHRRELVEQAARHCAATYPSKSIDIELAKSKASGTADITIASMQSITSGDRLRKFDPRLFKLVLVDEAHHIVAPKYLEILNHFGLDQKRPDSPVLVGVSATFSRADGVRLGAAIDQIVYHKDYVDMIQDKWLSNVIFTTVESTANLSKVKNDTSGDFQTGELSRAVNTEQINQITVRSWLAKAAGRKSTLVFCVDLAHVSGLTQMFRQYGVDARFITSNTPTLDRGNLLDAFRRGEYPVLVNCGIFTEGTDIPNIDCVLLARPTRSRNLLVQMIGRGMRLHSGKENCHIIDMVSNLAGGIVTTPTLFGLDPSELVKEASVDAMRHMKERQEAEKERRKSVMEAPSVRPPVSGGGVGGRVTFTEYDSVFDLIADSSGERHIWSMSRYAWVQVDPHKYVLQGNGAFIRIIKDDTEDENVPRYTAWETRSLPKDVSKTPYAKPRRILEATTFADAVHGADRYAAEFYPDIIISRSHRWRQGPPSEGQLEFLKKLQGKNGKELKSENLTKGKVMDMITKVKHGARGRFAALEAGKRAERRRQEKQISQEQQWNALRLREQVTVGPVPV